MRNKNLVFVLIGAVLFGLLAATSVSQYLAGVRAKNTLSNIVVAKVDIPLGARIGAEHLTTVQVPLAAMPAGTFTTLDQLPGRIAITKISAREPILASRLAPVGASGGLSAMIPGGYRAMTVRVDDETGIAGFLVPGTLVDILAVISANDSKQGPISKIVLQNIKVLANGQNLDQPKDEREATSVKTITLQVTPDQSEKLALASSEGKLRLALRNSGDRIDEDTMGATKRSLLGERVSKLESETPRVQAAPASKPVHAPRKNTSSLPPTRPAPNYEHAQTLLPEPAKPKPTVEVFEGSKKRTVVFP